MYVPLCLRWITSKNLPYSRGNSAQLTQQPGWEGNLGRVDTCVCRAESLHSSPGTVTTLIIGYTPLQHVFGVKKERKKERRTLRLLRPLELLLRALSLGIRVHPHSA